MFRLFVLLLLACQFARYALAILPRDEGVDGQSRRTMFNIIWGCVSTTIICAWASIHPNIPPREGPLKRALRRVELMLWTILAPEILPSWALNQRLAASTIRDVYNEAKGYRGERRGIWKAFKGWVSLYEITDAVNPAWTLKHGHLLIMGGIHLVDPVESDEISGSLGSPGKEESPSDVVSIEPRGTDTEKGHAPSEIQPNRPMCRVTILTLGILEELVKDPEFEISVTEDEIMDKSKGDAMAKIIFMLQSSWFIVQCVARRVQGLDITQLELTTLALASLNAVTFILWWDKPLGAQTPIRVYLKQRLTDEVRYAKGQNTKHEMRSVRSDLIHNLNFRRDLNEICDIVLCRSEDNILVSWVVKLPFRILFLLLSPITLFVRLLQASFLDLVMTSSFPVDATRVPTFYVPEHSYSAYWHIVLLSILAPIFGGIHCLGWDFIFPTATKQQLWRVASIAVTTTPFCFPVLISIPVVWNHVRYGAPLRFYVEPTRGVLFTTLVCLLLYMGARIMLLVLAIVLLTNQQPSAFIAVDWTKFFPRIL